MRFLAGFVLLGLWPALSLAQASGEVESIGFDNHFRPNCWTPMVIRLVPEKSGTYQIRVKQQDLDRDLPIFSEKISLTASAEGRSPEQRFWMYFLPQPTDGGLLDTNKGGTLKELQEQLHVYLCDENGKQLNQIPITSTITNLDVGAQSVGYGNTIRGNKLILCIGEGRSQPMWRDYQAPSTVGLMEDMIMVTLPPAALPEDIRGYEAVDGVVWLNAAVPSPAVPTEEKRHRALQEYVRSGGRLVICQPPQREQTAAFGDMLPVTVNEIREKADLEPLRSLAEVRTGEAGGNDWNVQGPFRFARAQPREGAIVDKWIDWNPRGATNTSTTQPADKTPYLVRAGYGMGSVTWVANDLGDPMITKARSGWPHVWDTVLGLANDTLVIDTNLPKDEQESRADPFKASDHLDLGPSLLKGMELQSKTRSLISLAVLFFVVYWVIAGPGMYFYLLAKSRSHLSWFLFAASALVATLLTVLLVRLVVRGAPELQHVTIVRKAADHPAIMLSRFGLYIPRDGPQEIALRDLSPDAVSYVTPFPEHPDNMNNDEGFTANLEYEVPVSEASQAAASISVPYRRTLKKLQARWVGTLNGGVEGHPKLVSKEGRELLEGVVINNTGNKLVNVYFVFKEAETGRENVFFKPGWDKGVSFELSSEFDDNTKFVRAPDDADTAMRGMPENGVNLQGPLVGGTFWTRYWFYEFGSAGALNNNYDDSSKAVKRSFPVMSLFDRLPPMRNEQSSNRRRVELLRRGGRQLDCSPAIVAGQLLVLAEAEGEPPLPFPLEVEGERVGGKGTIYYQFVLPLPRENADATTQPIAPSAP